MITIPGFNIEHTLGRGGMATVYLAIQESLGRRVALKVLDPTLAASDPEFSQRFLREGRIAAALRHRHILAIFDVGVHQGMAYLALEYLPGGSLAERGQLAPADALRMLREMAMALTVAHAAGIVHRDVKPENILCDADGGFVLADFGIARIAAASVVTKEGSTVGTPAYMAPEQWRNQTLDGRTDLYSLGVVFYQTLSGTLPYSGNDGWAIGMQHMQAPLPRLPDALAALQPLLARLLAKEPATRFASAADLLAALPAFEQLAEFAATGNLQVTTPLSQSLERLREQPAALAALFDDEDVAPEVTPASAPATRSSTTWTRRIGIGGALLLIAVFGGFALQRGGMSFEQLLANNDSLATVAVLPCHSYTDDADERMLGNVLAEELIHRLSRLRALTVIARSSSFPLSAQGLGASEIGQRLRASHLLACSIRPASRGVRISAELVDTGSGTQRWSAEFDRDSEQLLDVVDELAIGISERLLENLAGAERARLIRHRTESVEAIRLIEQSRRRTREATLASVDDAKQLIEQALALDPDYALAHVAAAELALAQMQLFQRDASGWRSHVEPPLARALTLDAELPAALVLRSQLRCAERDWAGCRADIDQALQFEPGNADAQASAATFHMTLGSRAAAVNHALRLVQIEPEAPRALDTLALALIHADRADDALTSADQAIKRFPENWPSWRARAIALEQLGRCDAGVQAYEKALALADAPLELTATGASLYACAGRLDKAHALLREFIAMRASGDSISDMAFAVTYLALGEREQALDALEAMLASGDARLWQWLPNRLHNIDALTSEPRFIALLERLQLPPGALRKRA